MKVCKFIIQYDGFGVNIFVGQHKSILPYKKQARITAQ